MTNERDSNETDTLVSETYRTLADERTPEHLNERVLRMAADPRRRMRQPGSTLFDTWMKPAAWAATVGLSLAIVLEVTQVADSPEENSLMPPAAETKSVRDQFIPQDTQLLNQAEEIANARSGPNKTSADQAKPVVTTNDLMDARADAKPSLKVQTQTPESAFEKNTNKEKMPASVPAQTSNRSETAALESNEVRRRTEEPEDAEAQPQSETLAPSSPPAPKELEDRDVQLEAYSGAILERSSTAEKRASDAAGACDGDARETAETWFDCIEALSAAGKYEDAVRENDAFKRRYPDFLPHK